MITTKPIDFKERDVIISLKENGVFGAIYTVFAVSENGRQAYTRMECLSINGDLRDTSEFDASIIRWHIGDLNQDGFILVRFADDDFRSLVNRALFNLRVV